MGSTLQRKGDGSSVQNPLEDRTAILHVSRLFCRMNCALSSLCSATIGINICTAVVILLPSVAPTIRELMLYFDITIVNVMACRSFRRFRLEMMQNRVPSFSMNLGGIGDSEVSTTGDLEWASPSHEASGSMGDDDSTNPTEQTAAAEEVAVMNTKRGDILQITNR